MSTRTTVYSDSPCNTEDHDLSVHLYEEMHDDLIYLELGCTKCNSGIQVPVSKHIADMLIGRLKRRIEV
jgi:hypothetical protein